MGSDAPEWGPRPGILSRCASGSERLRVFFQIKLVPWTLAHCTTILLVWTYRSSLTCFFFFFCAFAKRLIKLELFSSQISVGPNCCKKAHTLYLFEAALLHQFCLLFQICLKTSLTFSPPLCGREATFPRLRPSSCPKSMSWPEGLAHLWAISTSLSHFHYDTEVQPPLSRAHTFGTPPTPLKHRRTLWHALSRQGKWFT